MEQIMTITHDLGKLWHDTQRRAARALGEQSQTEYDYRGEQ
jgi:hypothetical protein